MRHQQQSTDGLPREHRLQRRWLFLVCQQFAMGCEWYLFLWLRGCPYDRQCGDRLVLWLLWIEVHYWTYRRENYGCASSKYWLRSAYFQCVQFCCKYIPPFLIFLKDQVVVSSEKQKSLLSAPLSWRPSHCHTARSLLYKPLKFNSIIRFQAATQATQAHAPGNTRPQTKHSASPTSA